MSSLKARKPHIIKRRLTLLSIGLLSLTSCLQTTGALYVSHPQIHTRERLVEQRQREQQWIEKQLGEADRIQTTYQGLRDFREFVGFYNELAVSLNPAQGKLDQLTNDTRAAELNAQLWKQRTAELEAYRSYVAALKGDDQTTSKSPEATTNTKTENNTAQPPSLSTPYGTTPSGITLPNPNDLVKTKAEAHPLDLFYDRLAYRNAVNAALKSNQLDDSHDFAGQMLYELTLSVSLTPGDRSKQFAQVELEVQYDPLERRAPEIARLYDNWVAALRMNMVAEIGHLQRRLMEHKLTEYDRRYFRWFVESFGPALYVRLQGELTERSSSKTISEFPVLAFFDLLSKKNAEVLPTLKENLTTMTPDEVKLINSNYSFSAVDVKELKSLLDEINQIERSLPEKYLDQTLSEPLPEKQLVAFRKAVAWAVWGAHYIELNKIVGITAPQLDKGTGFLSGGLMVMERRAYDSEKKVDDRKELRDGKERGLLSAHLLMDGAHDRREGLHQSLGASISQISHGRANPYFPSARAISARCGMRRQSI